MGREENAHEILIIAVIYYQPSTCFDFSQRNSVLTEIDPTEQRHRFRCKYRSMILHKINENSGNWCLEHLVSHGDLGCGQGNGEGKLGREAVFPWPVGKGSGRTNLTLHLGPLPQEDSKAELPSTESGCSGAQRWTSGDLFSRICQSIRWDQS